MVEFDFAFALHYWLGLCRLNLISVTSFGSSATCGSEDALDLVTVFEDQMIQFTGEEHKDEAFHFRLMKAPVAEVSKTYLLVIFLHRAGKRGSDNKLRLLYLPTQMAQSEWREKFPYHLFAPQCRKHQKWTGRFHNPNDAEASRSLTLLAHQHLHRRA